MVKDGYMDYVFEVWIHPNRVEKVHGPRNTFVLRDDLYFSDYKKRWCGPFEDFDENIQGKAYHPRRRERSYSPCDDICHGIANIHF